MEIENNNKGGPSNFITKIILIAFTLLGATLVNKKLKEHNLRFPTLGEFIILAFAFSIAAWILPFVVLVIVKIIHLFF